MSNHVNLPKILIVDDMESIHEDFKKIFKNDTALDPLEAIENQLFDKETDNPVDTRKIFRLDSAYQGQEGLEKIRTSNEKKDFYHLAFVDMRMPPGWDGLKTIEEILKVDNNIQIVLCTAYSDYSWKEVTQRLGFLDRLLILKKPFDRIEVIQLAISLSQKWILMNKMNQLIEDQTNKIKAVQEHLYQTSKLTAIGKLAGGVAHEINNPLTIIQNYSEQIKELLNDDNVNNIQMLNFIEGINKNINRIVKIINHLNEFGSQTLSLSTPIDLNEVINSALFFFEKQFENDKITIEKLFCENAMISGDKNQLEQVFINLTLNSRDAMEGCEIKKITISTKVENNNILCVFGDTGSGMPEEIKNKIFDPFFTTKDVGKGTGLGLSVAYGIIKNHNGEMTTLSVGSQGTKFRLLLPIYLVSGAKL